MVYVVPVNSELPMVVVLPGWLLPVNRRPVDISNSVLSGSERLLRFRRRRDPCIGDKVKGSEERVIWAYSDASGGI